MFCDACDVDEKDCKCNKKCPKCNSKMIYDVIEDYLYGDMKSIDTSWICTNNKCNNIIEEYKTKDPYAWRS